MLEERLRILQLLVESAGGSLEPVGQVLGKNQKDVQAAGDLAQLDSLRDTAIAGFFHCAAKGITFTDLGRIKAQYGRSLEDVYPWGTPTFMKLARTYWTFKVALIECGRDESACANLLWAIDEAFAGVFFPTPGPFAQPRDLRENAMRLLIEESSADFDVEDYLRNNPYLQ